MTFENDRFVDISLSFNSQDFATIEEIFVKRYGKPTKSERSTVSNPIGAKFTNVENYWIGKVTFIHLSKYAAKVTEGIALIAQRSQLDKFQKNKEREINDAVKNM